MTDTPPGPETLLGKIDALEREIATLPDVRAVRVVATDAGRVTEVHLVAEGAKSPKQLVRDVESLAHARFGIEIDRRVVSVVRFGTEELAAPVTAAQLVSLSWSTEGSRTTCRVHVQNGGATHIGEASGPATAVGRVRLAAQATTQALAGFESLRPVADVNDLQVVDVGAHRVAVAVVVFLSEDRSESTCVGSALSRGDEGEAVVRAILDAFNRGT